ncbi:pre-mRNA-splicing factor syf1 [Chytridiales sp. JEL 0842]|nr:pre-mRNA-splicing factor syf1 [Chytridiales sp. JEL 0842]
MPPKGSRRKSAAAATAAAKEEEDKTKQPPTAAASDNGQDVSASAAPDATTTTVDMDVDEPPPPARSKSKDASPAKSKSSSPARAAKAANDSEPMDAEPTPSKSSKSAASKAPKLTKKQLKEQQQQQQDQQEQPSLQPPPPVESTAPAKSLTKDGFDLDSEVFFFIQENDIVFEEECLRNGYNVKTWLRYLEHKQEATPPNLAFLYERALSALPGSYKLWKSYLLLRVSPLLDVSAKPDPETGLVARKKSLIDPEWEEVNSVFERAIVFCHKYPVIWTLYLRFLLHQALPTRTRRAFDRCLKSLPITQHKQIWELYLPFARRCGGETAVSVWKRYLKLEPEQAEEYVDVLLHHCDPPKYAEAARVLATLVEDPKFGSKKGKPTFQLWTEFCDLVCEHADDMDELTSDNIVNLGDESSSRSGLKVSGVVAKLQVEQIIRSGISRFSDQVGRLWGALARWWIARGEFEVARDVFEEAMVKVKTVRDFTMVFDAYAEFEESVLAARMEAVEERDEDYPPEDAADEDLDIDLRLARLEYLMKRRPFLVNDVKLRQNPNNVNEWERRVLLWKEREEPVKVVETYSEAVATINPKRATGKFHLLWTNFAHYYEENGDLENARKIFERATNVPFKKVDDLAEVWCQWAEMELRHDEFEAALEVMGRATVPPRPGKNVPTLHTIRYNDENLAPHLRLFKSIKLWSFYVDLEESIGTVESAKAVYERIMELKIATPQIVINCANFLEENKWFEESYRMYERGIDLFGYPIAFELWNLYLKKFVARHGASKLERARDLFEQSLEKCPPEHAKVLYLMYAKLEEDYGLARHAMKIYDRSTSAVSREDRADMFNIYIAKAISFFGLIAAREIYEKAIEVLPDKQARTFCVRFAELETKLMEVDRARAVWGFGSQFADPRQDAEYWKLWQEFEVKHGNEDTFKEMLRIKRSVQAKFNTDVTFISNQILAQRGIDPTSVPEPGTLAAVEAEAQRLEEEMEEEEAASSIRNGSAPSGGSRIIGFVPAQKRNPLGNREIVGEENGARAPAAKNADEIEISDSDDDDDNNNDDGDEEMRDAPLSDDEDAVNGVAGGSVRQKAVPDGVFGGLKALAEQKKKEEEEEAKALGAKERFKRKR